MVVTRTTLAALYGRGSTEQVHWTLELPIVELPDRGVSPRNDSCVVCGRPIRGEPRWGALFVGGNRRHLAPVEHSSILEDFDPGYMGAFPVGSECRRELCAAIEWVDLDSSDYVFNWRAP